MAKRAADPVRPDRHIDFELRQAQTVLDQLSRRQIEQLYGSVDDAAELHRAARRAAIAEASGPITPELLAERASALQVGQQAARPIDRVLPLIEVAFKIAGWFWLGTGLLAIISAIVLGGMPTSDVDDWEFPGIAAVLFTAAVLSFPIAGGLLVLRNLTYRRRDERVRAALIEWAMDRPGQLARGLPGSIPRSKRQRQLAGAIGSGINPLVTIVVWTLGVIGAVGAVVGLIALAFSVLLPPRDWQFAGTMTIWVGISGAVLGTAVLIHRAAGRAALRYAVLSDALDWVWEDSFAEVGDQHSADPKPPDDQTVTDAHRADKPRRAHPADPQG